MALLICACADNTESSIQSYSESSTPIQSAITSEHSASSESPEEQVQAYCNTKNCGEETKIPSKVYEIFVESGIIPSTENAKYYPNKSNSSEAADCSFSIGKYDFVAKGYVRKTDEISISNDADSDLNGYEYTLNSIQSGDGKKIYWTELGLEDKENANLEKDCSDLIPRANPKLLK